jgi:hypothetical protein
MYMKEVNTIFKQVPGFEFISSKSSEIYIYIKSQNM